MGDKEGSTPGTIDAAWFRFSQPMDTRTGNFDPAQDIVSFVSAGVPLVPTAATWQDAQTLVITFPPQPADNPLRLVLGPQILSAGGVALDQDEDGQAGETPDDQYTANLSLDVTGPRVFLTTPQQRVAVPFDQITFHFNEAIDAATFSVADVSAFRGPDGSDLRSQLTDVLVAGPRATVYFRAQAASGQYSMTIGPNIADPAGNLMDQNRDGSPGQPADVFTVTLDAQSPDLTVTAVSNPVAAVFPEILNLSWTVTNVGTSPATGAWWDYVYLSQDDKWDLQDPLVGKVLYDSSSRGVVAAGTGSYQGVLAARMPGVFPGDYRVIVRTNILETLPETTRSNNTGLSPGAALLDLPVIAADLPVSVPVASREQLYYKFTVTPEMVGGSLVVRLGTSDTTSANELYVSRNALPTRIAHDTRSEQGLTSNQYIILSSIKTGTYYILAAISPDRQQVAPVGRANISVDLFLPGEFTVLDTHFGKGGTAGNRTIEINGVNFDRTITVHLTDDAGFSHEAISYYRVGPKKLYATFDLTAVLDGTYDVAVSGIGGQTQTLSDSFEVISGGGWTNAPTITAPGAFRRVFHEPLVHFPMVVTWENTGINDAPMPFIQIENNEPFHLELDEALNGNGVFTDTFVPYDASVGHPGILLPGESGSRTYHVVPRLRQEVSDAETMLYSANRLFKHEDWLFDWSQLRRGLPECGCSFDVSDAVLDQLKSQVGSTDADFGRMLARNMAIAPLNDGHPASMVDLIWMESDLATAAIGTSVSGKISASTFEVALTGAAIQAENVVTGDVYVSPVWNDGSFVFPRVQPGDYHFTFSGGVLPSVDPTTARDGGPTNVVFHAQMGGQITGVVIDSQSALPIVSAKVLARSESQQFTSSATTDDQGRFVLRNLPPEGFHLQLEAAGFGTVVAGVDELSVGQLLDMTLEMTRAGRIAGTLRNGHSQQPISGIQGLVVPVGHAGVAHAFVTDVNGLFLVDRIDRGEYAIQFSDATYVFQELPTLNISSAITSNVSIEAIDAASIAGSVAFGSHFIVDALTLALYDNTGEQIKVATLDDHFSFVIDGLSAGAYRLDLCIAGTPFRSFDIVLSPGEHSALSNIDIGIAAIVNGAVHSLRNPATIVVESLSGNVIHVAATQPDGMFQLGFVADGNYRVRVFSDSGVYEPIELSVAGGTVLPDRLDFRPGVESLTGQVLLPDGHSAVSSRVYARRLAAGQITSETVVGESDSGGQFELSGLTPGSYRLYALLAGYGYAAATVDVAEGGLSALTMRLVPTNVLRAIITAADGFPAVGAEVVLYELESGAIAGFQKADDQGEIEITDLPYGQFEVKISFEGAEVYFQSDVEIASTHVDLNVRLLPSATTVNGIVRIANGVPVIGAYVYVTDTTGKTIDSTVTAAGGAFVFGSLPSTAVLVVVEGNGAVQSAAEEIDLAETPTADGLQVIVRPAAVGLVSAPVLAVGEAEATPSANGSVWDNYLLDEENLEAIKEDIGLPEKPECLSEEANRLYDKARAAIKVMEMAYGVMEGRLNGLHHSVNVFFLQAVIDLGRIAIDVASLFPVLGSIHRLFTLASGLRGANVIVASANAVKNTYDIFDGIKTTFSDEKSLVQNANGAAGSLNSARALGQEAIETIVRLRLQTGSILDAASAHFSRLRYEQFAKDLGKLAGVVSLIQDLVSAADSMIAGLHRILEANKQFNSSVSFFNEWKQKAKEAVAAYNAAVDDQKVRADAIDDEFRGKVGKPVSGNVLGNDIPLDCVEGSIFVTSSRPDIISRNGSFTFTAHSPGTYTISYSIGIRDKDGREIIVDNALVTITIIDRKDCPPPPDPCVDPAGYNQWLRDCPCDDNDSGGATADCGSQDPNDIIGPYGPGNQHWVDGKSRMEYMIRFENHPEEATAPAAIVRVTQLLDSDLDASTFRLGLIGFGDTALTAPIGVSSYRTQVDLRESRGIFLDVSAGINVESGEIFWEFKSIDPETGEVPFNPFLGFLPPNKDGSEGQGYVSYSIKPKANVKTGDIIDAVASIIFDQNEPIDTPPIFNTIDSAGPTSAVGLLAAESYPGFLVKWQGEDDAGGSGVASYDVFVSRDGGPYRKWLAATTNTQAYFLDARPGHTYAFYSVASDLVGHVEIAATVPDTQTTVIQPPRVDRVVVPPRGVNSLQVVFSDPMLVAAMIADGSINEAIRILDQGGKTVSLAEPTFQYDPDSRTLAHSWQGNLAAGAYTLKLDAAKFAGTAGGELAAGYHGPAFQVTATGSGAALLAGGAELRVSGDPAPTLADWNADGLPDLAVAHRTGLSEAKIRVYLNQGSSSLPVFSNFTYAQTAAGDLIVPASSTFSASARLFDWNGDGEDDLVLGLADGRVQVWTNVNTDAEPIFGLPRYVQVGPAGAKSDIDVGDEATVAIIDWNGDGRYDLVLGALDGGIRVYINQAAKRSADLGSEQLLQIASAPLYVSAGRSQVAVGDLNRDGLPDLLVGNAEGQLLFYPNAGTAATPAFVAGWVLPLGEAASNSTAARRNASIVDHNGDSLPDILVSEAGGLIKWYAAQPELTDVNSYEPARGVPEAASIHTFTAGTGNLLPWQNPRIAWDVDNDGNVSPLDALIVINYLNLNGSRALPVQTGGSGGPPPFLDTDGDDHVSPLDLLLIINFLNSTSAGITAEAEASSPLRHNSMLGWNPLWTDPLPTRLSQLGRYDAATGKASPIHGTGVAYWSVNKTPENNSESFPAGCRHVPGPSHGSDAAEWEDSLSDFLSESEQLLELPYDGELEVVSTTMASAQSRMSTVTASERIFAFQDW